MVKKVEMIVLFVIFIDHFSCTVSSIITNCSGVVILFVITGVRYNRVFLLTEITGLALICSL
jgi:hypothetical protein